MPITKSKLKTADIQWNVRDVLEEKIKTNSENARDCVLSLQRKIRYILYFTQCKIKILVKKKKSYIKFRLKISSRLQYSYAKKYMRIINNRNSLIRRRENEGLWDKKLVEIA